MIRRSRSNVDSLPTHGSSGELLGFSNDIRGYGGYNGGGTSSGGGGYGYSSKYSKRRHNIGCSSLTIVGLGLFVFNLILTGVWMRSRGHFRSLLKVINAKDGRDAISKVQWTERRLANVKHDIATEARATKRRYESEKRRLEKENDRLQRERDELRRKYESLETKSDGSRLKLRETAYLHQISLMQEAIRKESKRNVLERFGPGPHEVQMTFVHENAQYEFVIELAPLNAVPHAIHLFLEQVQHGLWDGACIYGNTVHVLQAGPSPPDESEEQIGNKTRPGLERFENLQLDSLAFPDYSHEFPHDIWTVGFAGRPGGPDFYINKMDNIKGHGPGGQIQHALEEQGDSCFGRITKGKEKIEDMLFKQPTFEASESKDFLLLNPVSITRAVILTPKPSKEARIDMDEMWKPVTIEKPMIEVAVTEES